MATPNKKLPQIRVNRYKSIFWIHNYRGGVYCSDRKAGIEKLKESFPGEYDDPTKYEIVDVEQTKANGHLHGFASNMREQEHASGTEIPEAAEGK